MVDDPTKASTGGPPTDSGAGPSTVRHLGGFVASGLLAFLVDAAILEIGTRLLGLDPRLARVAAVATAMVVAWLAHRRWTFAMPGRPTLPEFARYAAASWSAAAVNYLVFIATLTLWPLLPPLAALVGATGISTVFSYFALRYGVFLRAS